MCNLELPHRLLPPPEDESRAHLAPLVDDGLLASLGDRYQVTPMGRYFLRNIAMALDAHLSRQRQDARPLFSRTV
jgi:coproporphyrinogen III oxidase-like Fe-S oxidoreductase